MAHVHAHVVPRNKGDLANNDEIYGLIDGWTPLDACGAPVTLDVPDDAARKPRSAEDMAAEALRYRRRGDPFPEPSNVTFGPFAVDASQVFFESGTCRALVNLKPLVAGHVLVVPKAVVPTLGEMDEELHRDLWRAARRVELSSSVFLFASEKKAGTSCANTLCALSRSGGETGTSLGRTHP